MAFWLALRCWIPCVTRCPRITASASLARLTPDPTIHTVVQGIAQNAGSAATGGDHWRRLGMDAAKAVSGLASQGGGISTSKPAWRSHDLLGTGSGSGRRCVISDPDKASVSAVQQCAVGYGDPPTQRGAEVVSVPPQITTPAPAWTC